MASEQFSLCWDNFHKNMSSGMNSLLENEDLVDVTLAVEGKYLKAHKMVLSVCSPYFKELFKVNPCKHPIVFMKDVSYIAMSDLLQFMYQGEVQVSQENLTTFIKTAEALQIKGLTGDGNGSTDCDTDTREPRGEFVDVKEHHQLAPKSKKVQPPPHPAAPAPKRQRVSTSSLEQPVAPSTVTKTEPVVASNPTSEQIIQFKMEPYEQSQSVTVPDDNADDTFNDDPLDDTNADDTNEDYSMMEGGDEEPQAGTSADGTAGEGQASDITQSLSVSGKLRRETMRIVHSGFSYHNSRTNPPVRYLICANYLKSGCYGRAVMPLNGTVDDIKVTQPHNHPPDESIQEKATFYGELKSVVESASDDISLKTLYEMTVKMFPKMATVPTYDSVRTSMRRWKLKMKYKLVESN